MKNKTQQEWAIAEYKHGLDNGQNGNEYQNPYRPETASFSNYEQGFVEGKQTHINQSKK